MAKRLYVFIRACFVDPLVLGLVGLLLFETFQNLKNTNHKNLTYKKKIGILCQQFPIYYSECFSHC